MNLPNKLTVSRFGLTVVFLWAMFSSFPYSHTLALIFALRRSLVPYVLDVRRGKWQTINQFCYFDHPIRDIADSTLGLIGYGALGKSVGKRAEALGMKVIATDVYDFPGKVDLDTILRESDVISLHCPLTEQTRNVIGAAELVVQAPCRVVFVRVPIKPRPALRFGKVHQILHQQAAKTAAAKFGRDEQVFKITGRRDRPCGHHR